MKKQKKFFVSLCLKVPANFNVEVEAKNEKDAFEKAMSMFEYNWDEKYMSEPFWQDVDLDIKGKDENALGVHIEEI